MADSSLIERLRDMARFENGDYGAATMAADALEAAEAKFVEARERWIGEARRHLERLRSEAERRAEAAERERDLAIAHDRQPYPTADAYEKVCAARTKWQMKAERYREALERAALNPPNQEPEDCGCPMHMNKCVCRDPQPQEVEVALRNAILTAHQAGFSFTEIERIVGDCEAGWEDALTEGEKP